ncbi:Glycerate kinase [Neofusicoccum parvum]|uniref:Glycerate kinase n=1 Tax=Neofusicoccum parvum TaxID=310453 RepID=A0ACB5SLJ7_9PEZI|nr:Glycerate kinase [Neofusicoccum parvum]
MKHPTSRSTKPSRSTRRVKSAQPPMRILVSPSGFKESLGPSEVASCIEAGIRRVVPDADVRKVPLADGGEGFARALVEATGGTLHTLTVTGPTGAAIPSHFGMLGGKEGGPRTAVVEMAAAAGLALVPAGARDPTATTTHGVGELIAAALDRGAERVVVGCGDSGTSDGGAGMLQALGARLLDGDGEELARAGGGGDLARLADIDMAGLHPRVRRVEIDVACNWRNELCGPAGVARVYGPQKGATPAQVELLAGALDNYAAVARGRLGCDVARTPGGGASGGMGAGLVLLGARLRPRYEAVMEYFGIGDLFADCQLVITAEGGIDRQTPQGKIPAEVALRAKAFGIPVIALAGTVGAGADVNYNAGIDAFTSILQAPTTLDRAIAEAEQLLTDAAEASMRMVLVGLALRM